MNRLNKTKGKHVNTIELQISLLRSTITHKRAGLPNTLLPSDFMGDPPEPNDSELIRKLTIGKESMYDNKSSMSI